MMEFQNAILVVAHPDDEIIWFSSILDECKSVLVCFGPSATSRRAWDAGRAELMETYPLAKVEFLKVRQADALGAANWKNPTVNSSGLQLRSRSNLLYATNAEALRRTLEAKLSADSIVFTHNPWGEYGHEEHVQVFRVLASLQEKLGFELFVNGYVSDRSAGLMSRYLHSFGGDPLVYRTNPDLALRIKNLYLEKNCWTWMADYEWPEHESFNRVIQTDERIGLNTSASLPLNYITYQFNENKFRTMGRRIVPTAMKSLIKRFLTSGE